MQSRINNEWLSLQHNRRQILAQAIVIGLMVFTACDYHDRGVLPQIEYHSTSDAGPLILVKIDLLKQSDNDQAIRTLLKTAVEHYPRGFEQRVWDIQLNGFLRSLTEKGSSCSSRLDHVLDLINRNNRNESFSRNYGPRYFELRQVMISVTPRLKRASGGEASCPGIFVLAICFAIVGID